MAKVVTRVQSHRQHMHLSELLLLTFNVVTDLSTVFTTMSLISSHSATVSTFCSCKYDHSDFNVL